MHVPTFLPHPFDTSPSQRFRIEQWIRPLAGMGVELEPRYLFDSREEMEGLWNRPPRARAVATLLRRTMQRVGQVLRARGDAILLHREATMLGPAVLERLMAGRAPLVLDIDDAVWLPPEGAGPLSPTRLVRRPQKTDRIMRMSRAIAAGNGYLADYARPFCRDVEIVPTTIDVTHAYVRTKVTRSDGPLTVGWSGSHSTATYIRELLPVLAAAARRVPFRLLVIGAEVSHPELDIECRPWRSATEVDDLLAIDVGLMPLPDDPWTRGKCGLKALQYMALGIPAVVSPVGVNSEIVEPNRNGFTASTPDEWERAIVALQDAQLRAKLGAEARRTVVERYSSETGAERMAALLRRAAAH